MAENNTSAKPWAAIAAAAAFAALVGFQYFTLTALEAQSGAMQQMIDASAQSSALESRGLRTRQQLILSELRQFRVEAGTGHGAAVEEVVDEGGEGNAEAVNEADVDAENGE